MDSLKDGDGAINLTTIKRELNNSRSSNNSNNSNNNNSNNSSSHSSPAPPHHNVSVTSD